MRIGKPTTLACQSSDEPICIRECPNQPRCPLEFWWQGRWHKGGIAALRYFLAGNVGNVGHFRLS